MPRPNSFSSHEKSAFYKQLQRLENEYEDRHAVVHLIESVDFVARKSAAIADRVREYMPQYTLHDETHPAEDADREGSPADREPLPEWAAKLIQKLTPRNCETIKRELPQAGGVLL